MNTLFTLLALIIPILTFFLLETLFKLKTKLIKQFKTVRRYKLTIFIITFVPFLIYAWSVFFMDVPFNYLIFSISFLYNYLMYIPEELR